ncbi:uncharacterized protein MONBRDRAFT_34586 [Monosiga brevicollis MX1]|uniref:Mitochondrial carrier protein n=1 Tax=Monosiga brevicollis TaxID=81824 RepID=A9VCP2_MONBE|nr:uncharacterized protein MONBRDRAFT_34586 [Monosiga brevicollis MX1]EDQ84721.1 predicted protein [Monosiga brevicollis MX1]|eukprot:XP_001750507.1 hypothetical protein [Monosiga brevicollis MX1]
MAGADMAAPSPATEPKPGPAAGKIPPVQPAVIEWHHLDKTRFYILAPLGGLSTRIVLYPTQLIKTRLQVQTKRALYNGMVDAARKIIRHEGFFALYKGFVPNLVGLAGGQLYISLYESIKVKLQPTVPSEVTRNLLGGFLASTVAQTIVVPVNVVSQRMMVHGQNVDPNVARIPRLKAIPLIRSIFKVEGLRGFFTGYWASVAAFAPSSAIWWASYGAVRRWQQGYDVVKQGGNTMLLQSLGGSSAGVITAVVTNPLDVVRARLQVGARAGDGQTFSSILKELMKEEGIRGLYKGVTARMVYMGCNSFFLIAAYETVKRLSLKADAHLLDAASDGTN